MFIPHLIQFDNLWSITTCQSEPSVDSAVIQRDAKRTDENSNVWMESADFGKSGDEQIDSFTIHESSHTDDRH